MFASDPPSAESLTAASLGDDVDSVRAFLSAPADEYLVLWHELGRLVGLLQGLAYIDFV